MSKFKPVESQPVCDLCDCLLASVNLAKDFRFRHLLRGHLGGDVAEVGDAPDWAAKPVNALLSSKKMLQGGAGAQRKMGFHG